MQLSIDLSQQIISLVMMSVVGFILCKKRLITTEQSKILSRVAVYVFIPCAMFHGFQTVLDESKLSGLWVSVIAAVVIHIAFMVGAKLLKRPLSLSNEERACAIYNNAGSLVIPMVMGISSLGSEYVFYTCAYVAVQNILMWSHGMSIMGGQKVSAKKIFLNPCMIGIFLGIICFFMQWMLPTAIAGTVSGFASCLGPVTMLTIGMMLGEQDLKAVLKNKRVYVICAIRLVAFPLMIAVLLLPLKSLWAHADIVNILTVSLLCGIGPTAGTITQQAQIFNNPHRGYLSAINVVSTMLCVVTMPLVIFIFQMMIA